MLVHILTNVDMIKSGIREIELIYGWSGYILYLWECLDIWCLTHGQIKVSGFMKVHNLSWKHTVVTFFTGSLQLG